MEISIASDPLWRTKRHMRLCREGNIVRFCEVKVKPIDYIACLKPTYFLLNTLKASIRVFLICLLCNCASECSVHIVLKEIWYDLYKKYCLFQDHSRFVSLVGEITSQAEAFMGRKAVGCYKLVAVTKIYGLFGKLVLNQFYVRKIELRFIYINYFGLYTFDFSLFWCVLSNYSSLNLKNNHF